MHNLSWRMWRVWRRDFDVYITTWFVNFLPPFLEPILYLFAFGLGLGRMVENVQYQGMTLSYMQFIAPGIVAITTMFHAYYECLYGSFVRMYYQKSFDAIIATPLTLEDVIGGEILWGATKGAIAATIMMVPVSMFGFVRYPWGLLIPLVGLLGGMVFGALGMCFTGICPTIDTFNFPVFLLITPMMLFSGTFFPLDMLPGWAVTIAYCLPLTHLAELYRSILLGVAPPHLVGNLVMLVGGSIVLFPLALALMRRRLVS
ncbi:ABC transporter permease [bacterium]|nr:ABC transporter permease [candidate division CSSED10-310 bacterium]